MRMFTSNTALYLLLPTKAAMHSTSLPCMIVGTADFSASVSGVTLS